MAEHRLYFNVLAHSFHILAFLYIAMFFKLRTFMFKLLIAII